MIFGSASGCLLLVVIFCFGASEHQATISHIDSRVRDNIIGQQNFQVSNLLLDYIAPVEPEQTRGKPEKFLILTTGDHLKLYPFASQKQRQDQDNVTGHQLQTLANHHYLIKPSVLISTKRDSYTRKYGDTSLARWLYQEAERNRTLAIQRGRAEGNQKSTRPTPEIGPVSILPQGLETQFRDNQKTGYSKPLISDVDYFFDTRFCRLDGGSSPSRESLCLVVVWLDSSNRLVRFGSVNLAKYIISNQEPNLKANTMIWLDEFKPLDLGRYLALWAPSKTMDRGHPVGIVIDRRRSRLHVAFSERAGSFSPNLVLTAEFKVKYRQEPENEGIQLEIVDRRPTSGCKGARVGRPTENSQGLVLDATGNWLFYLNHGDVLAVFVGPNEQIAVAMRESWLDDEEIECFMRNNIDGIFHWRVPERWHQSGPANSTKAPSLTALMAQDSLDSRIYWLTRDNKLMSSDNSGSFVRYHGSLPPRPKLLRPTKMAVSQDTIFISDLIKKSLVAYKISEPSESDGSYPISGRARKLVSEEPNIPFRKHQVLLVEMTPILGFRIMDLEYGKSDVDQELRAYLSADAEQLEALADIADVTRVKIETQDYDLMDDHEINGSIPLPNEQLGGDSDDLAVIELFFDLNTDGAISDTPRNMLGTIMPPDDGEEFMLDNWRICIFVLAFLVATILGIVFALKSLTLSMRESKLEPTSQQDNGQSSNYSDAPPPGYSPPYLEYPEIASTSSTHDKCQIQFK